MTDAPPPLLFQRRGFWLGVAILAGLILVYEVTRDRQTKLENVEFRPDRYMKPQPFIAKFAIKKAEEIQGEIADDELVLGVTIANEARAYPLNMMYASPAHKVLNDTLAAHAIAVTWCDKCMAGVVFDRNVDGRELTLGIFGQLWNDSMVLYNQDEAGAVTQWSQLTGVAQAGPLRGKKLARLPGTCTDWQTWRTLHPETSVVVLERSFKEFGRTAYQDAAAYVLGYEHDGVVKAWSLDELKRDRAINDHVAKRPVVAVFLESSGTARLFERLIAKGELTFSWEKDELRDRETQSVWDPRTGRAVSGPLAGTVLTPASGLLAKKDVWHRFYPPQ